MSAIRQALERSQAVLGREADLRGFRDCYALLTPREREVMVLVVSGLLNKQVGWELGISAITVKAHRGQHDAKGEGGFAGRPGENGRETSARTSAIERLRFMASIHV